METREDLGDVAAYTLVVPSVSIGNTAQLAVDLLAETFPFQKQMPARHSALLPFVGLQDDSNSLLTEMQVHVSHEHKLVALQIRSGIIATRRNDFVNDLLRWIKSQGFARTLVLTSTDAMHRIDSQLEGSPLRALSTSGDAAAFEPIKPLELHKESGLLHDIFLPGGGFARRLFLSAKEQGDVPAVLVSIFTSAGENTMQAHMLADAAASVLHLSVPESGWRTPSSWRLLYGSGFGPGLF